MIEKKLTLDDIPDGTTYTKVTATEKSTFSAKQDGISAQPHIVDADGNLADITTKFNTLLAQLETLGILASS